MANQRMNGGRRIGAVSVIALLSIVGASGCGDDEDETSGDLERYCELEAELDAAGEELFANADPNASETDLLATFFEDNDAKFDELLEVAPDEIAEDAQAVYDANIAFIEGDEAAAEQAAEPDDRLTSFAEENCG